LVKLVDRRVSAEKIMKWGPKKKKQQGSAVSIRNLTWGEREENPNSIAQFKPVPKTPKRKSRFRMSEEPGNHLRGQSTLSKAKKRRMYPTPKKD